MNANPAVSVVEGSSGMKNMRRVSLHSALHRSIFAVASMASYLRSYLRKDKIRYTLLSHKEKFLTKLFKTYTHYTKCKHTNENKDTGS